MFMFFSFCVFFFFKQKTAYEMRISDWSSDVCSSDLDDIAWGGGSYRSEKWGEDLAAVGMAGCHRTIAFGLWSVEFSLQTGGPEMAVTGDTLVAGVVGSVSLCG